MWRTLFTIFYISAAVLANAESLTVKRSDNGIIVTYLTTNAFETSKPRTCPKGFEREGMYCYYVTKKKTNWFGAIQLCNRKDSNLARPLTHAIDRRLRKHLVKSKFKSVERWIDVTYNPKIQEWVLGTTAQKIPYDGFDPDQSELKLDQYCAVMDPRLSYTWIARICDKLNNYVCQTTKATTELDNSIGTQTGCPKDFLPAGINCYYIGHKNVTWSEATKICKEMNSVLAKSLTRDVDRELRYLLATSTSERVGRWIDVTYNSEIREWVLGTTGEKIPFNGFWNTEVSLNPDQHCAAMDPTISYAWIPQMCYKLKFAVCEILLDDPSPSLMPIASAIVSNNSLPETESSDSSKIPAHNMTRRPRMCPKKFRLAGMNCYHFSRRKARWLEAIQICREKNSSLANPLTKDLNMELSNLTARFKQVERWIDATYNPETQGWVLGTTTKEIPYDGFLEKSFNKTLDWRCIVVDPRKDFAWTPRLCQRRMHYVCQIPLGELPEKSPEKHNSLQTIKRQKANPHILKTNKTLNQNEITPLLPSVIRTKKESSLSLMIASETEPGVKNVVKLEDSNIQDQPKENLIKPFTGNYKTESRILAAESSSPLIKPTQLGSDSFDTEFLLKP